MMNVKKKWLTRAVIGFLLVYFLVDANMRVPLPEKSGTALTGQEVAKPPQRNNFTIATYNIRRSKGLDNKRDLSRAIGVLRDAEADIIGLNELSGTYFYGLNDQAAQVGSALGFAWLFAPTYRKLYQDYFGNGLVSRWPVSNWQILPLVVDEREKQSYRNMIVATIPMPGEALNVVITHLDRSGVRSRQLQQVFDYFHSLPEPAVLLGDLNTGKSDTQLVQFLDQSNAVDAIGLALESKERKIDWIISRGLKVVGGGTHERGVSDHPAFWVEFQIPERVQSGEQTSKSITF